MYCESIPQLPSWVGSQGKFLSKKGWWVSLHFTSFPDPGRREPFDIQPEGQRKTPPKLRVGTSPPPPAKYTAGSVLLLMHGSDALLPNSPVCEGKRQTSSLPIGQRGKSSASPALPASQSLPPVDFCSRLWTFVPASPDCKEVIPVEL